MNGETPIPSEPASIELSDKNSVENTLEQPTYAVQVSSPQPVRKSKKMLIALTLVLLLMVIAVIVTVDLMLPNSNIKNISDKFTKSDKSGSSSAVINYVKYDTADLSLMYPADWKVGSSPISASIVNITSPDYSETNETISTSQNASNRGYILAPSATSSGDVSTSNDTYRTTLKMIKDTPDEYKDVEEIQIYGSPAFKAYHLNSWIAFAFKGQKIYYIYLAAPKKPATEVKQTFDKIIESMVIK